MPQCVTSSCSVCIGAIPKCQRYRMNHNSRIKRYSRMPETATVEKVDKRDETFETRAQRIFESSKSARLLIEQRWARSADLYDSVFPRGVKAISDVFLGQSRLFIPKT